MVEMVENRKKDPLHQVFDFFLWRNNWTRLDLIRRLGSSKLALVSHWPSDDNLNEQRQELGAQQRGPIKYLATNEEVALFLQLSFGSNELVRRLGGRVVGPNRWWS